MKNKTILIFSSTLFLFMALSITPCFSIDIETFDDLFAPQFEKTISMDFTNANLNAVLKMFSQQSELNFIAATDVAAMKVNLYLDQVPVEEALERILSANNLTYEIDPGSNIFIVKEMKVSDKQLMTRVYPLKHATVPSSKLNTTLSAGCGDKEGASGSEETSLDSMGILGAITSVLTKNGSAIEDTRTNSIIVSDIPSQFPLIEQTIARLDVRIPQILIETEMLDITKSTADLLGAKFGNTPIAFAGPERDTIFPLDQNRAIRDLPKSGNQGFEFDEAEYRVGTLSMSGLSITLQFLRTKKDTRNLARPRILTLNNDTAEIFISTDEAIGLSSSTTSSEGTSTSIAEAERVQTGVFLKVTPQANIHTKEITMAIEPKVIQAKTGGTFGLGSLSQTFKDPELRGSKSILRIKDGDTIVLGGLLRTDSDEIKTRVPVLARIPVLGGAFRHKDKTESQRELIIFITPHIVEEDIDIARMAASKTHSIMREQSIPAERNQAIEKELSSFEEKRFNSYR
ncbi:MAG: secretin and TonB N-terminal domain-containing protein [Candidatus Omnitrophica bacterium]|nr:secretin and TonB N-terminal domain-containing protein [Candidatus Omnitrophota bacterium]